MPPTSQQPEEITATFLAERFRFANEATGDVIIGTAWMNGEVCEEIAIKGQADVDELQDGQEYRFYGKWTTYKNKRTGQSEPQFAFQSFVKQAPHGRAGVVAYLQNAGEGFGLGKVRAVKCWELWGSEAVKTLREQPELVSQQLSASGLRLTLDNAMQIAERLKEEQAIEACTLDLMDILNGRKFLKSTPRLAIREWGNRAAQIIRRNPYQLMRFPGAGFKKCDSLYLDLGKPRGALRRQGLAIWYTLASNTDGHTWFGDKFAESGMKELIPADAVNFENARRFARLLGATREVRTDGVNGAITPDGRQLWIAEATKAKHEEQLAQAIADASQEPTTWPDVSTIEGISEHQRDELRKALTGPIGILGGSPGTGKTYSLACLARELVKVYGANNILIGAPTGKAAVRVTENLSKYGLSLRARTWHSLLAGVPERGSFKAKVLIGDETSMNDTDLMAAVFRARSAGTHMLLVGDVNQLPPVGHGAPLRDMIAAGLPYGELRDIRRQDTSKPNTIVEMCAAIRDSKPWSTGDNLQLIHSDIPSQMMQLAIEQIAEARAAGLDPIWDCQVVVPVNKKSPLSRREFNRVLQVELNHRPGQQGSAFRAGDKIVNTKNAFFPAIDWSAGDDAEEIQKNDRGDVYVANGELAEVLEVQPGLVIAKLSSPDRTIKIPCGKQDDPESKVESSDEDSTGTGCSWDLGYALSVHKSQGSEWPVVIVMLDDYLGARMVCSREWLYTAISRAKQKCVLIGQKSVADRMCRVVALGKRKTLLKERILLARAKDDLANL